MAQKKSSKKPEGVWQEEFTQDKVCKHSVRYAFSMPNGQAFTVYIPNSILADPVPKKMMITLG